MSLNRIRTFVIAAVALASWGAPAFAQDQPNATRAGILVNVSSGSLGWKGSATLDPSRLIRVGAGVTFDVPLTDQFSIDFRLVTMRKGAKGTRTADSNIEGRVLLEYLSAPVLMKARLGQTGLYVLGGPEVGFAGGRQYVLKDDGETRSGTLENVRRFDYALTGGIGFASGSFFGEVMYSHGFRDVGAAAPPTFDAGAASGGLRTRTFFLNTGFRF